MADGDSFVLKLIDKLTGPARAMARALESVTKAESAVTAASGATTAAVAKAGAAVAAAGGMAARGAAGFDKAAHAMARATAGRQGVLDRMAKIRGMGLTAHRATLEPEHAIGPVLNRRAQNLSVGDKLNVATKGLRDWNNATGESISKWQEMAGAFMRTPFGMVLGGLGKIGGVLVDIISSLASALFTVGKLTLAMGALAAISFAKKAVEMASFAESSKQAFAFLTGGKASGDAAFGTGTSLAKQLGTDVEETVHQLIKLRSMQFSIGEGAEIIKLGADLKAITGDAQSAERAIVAMTQIKAKGKLQSEELVGQLAEAGVSTVLVYEQLEKLLGKDRNGVIKQIQAGKVDANTGLEAIKKAIMHKVGTDEAGTVGAAFANKTFAGLAASLKNAFQMMFVDIGQMIDMSPLKDGMRILKASFDFAERGPMVTFVNSMIAGVAKLIPLTIKFAQGFGTGLESIANALSFGNAGNLSQWAFEAGQGVAKFFTRVIEVSKEVVKVVPDALKALFDGLDVNGLLASIKSFDWAKFGSDLVVIAKALGSIVSATAKFIGGHVNGPEDKMKALRESGKSGWQKTYDMFDISPWGLHLGNMLPDSWNPSASMPAVEPVVGAAGGKTVQQKNNVNVTIAPPLGASRGEVEAMAFDAAKVMRREIQRMADTELAEAI